MHLNLFRLVHSGSSPVDLTLTFDVYRSGFPFSRTCLNSLQRVGCATLLVILNNFVEDLFGEGAAESWPYATLPPAVTSAGGLLRRTVLTTLIWSPRTVRLKEVLASTGGEPIVRSLT